MDIDDFLDRELVDLNVPETEIEKIVPHDRMPALNGSTETYQIFEAIKNNLAKGSLEEADEECVRLWHLLLDQKLEWNKQLYEQLSILTRQFSTALNSAYDEVKRKAQDVYQLINKGRTALKEGKTDSAFKAYSEMQYINDSIPNVFFEEKKIIGDQIVLYYKELRDVTDYNLIRRVSSLVKNTSELIEKSNSAIRQRNIPSAVLSYNKALTEYKQIPEGFLRHKNILGMRIIEIYKYLSIENTMSDLQKHLMQGPSHASENIPQAGQSYPQMRATSGKNSAEPSVPKQGNEALASLKKEEAKKYIQRGAYSQAIKEIEDSIALNPNDPESKALKAKIKTLQ
ncbi:MAG TPA: hypothetical protein VI564_08270 [Candidatus Nanoarchaeia archaeon]|nr:hypothetical protein [Candidatus Nanoarchaeia archaeon]